MNAITSSNPREITEIAALTYQGRGFLASRLRDAEEALRKRQRQMATDRASRYRKEIGTHSLGRMAYRIVVSSYPQGRRYALALCLELRGHIAAARRALAEWDHEVEADVSAAERSFLQAAE